MCVRTYVRALVFFFRYQFFVVCVCASVLLTQHLHAPTEDRPTEFMVPSAVQYRRHDVRARWHAIRTIANRMCVCARVRALITKGMHTLV